MANYVIGDIQGCYDKFLQLLAELSFNRGCDTLYLVGDVVNRGRNSLEMLQWCYNNSDIVTPILGNHDIYLLARYGGIRAKDNDDTLDDLLRVSNIDKLIAYVRSWGLITNYENNYIVHAGIHPQIDIKIFLKLEQNIKQQLRGENYISFIDSIYGNDPNYWNMELSIHQQMKFLINSSTRMRYINKVDMSLDYYLKCNPSKFATNDLVPWFQLAKNSYNIIFGHWASLGYMKHNNCIAIDTGCVWGDKLTAIDLSNQEIIQV
jgi:bis(5'-nucleosyl)-tetraphosphatase (symmetrical)